MTDSLKQTTIAQLAKARKHLEFSFHKLQAIDLSNIEDNNEELLETLESFSSRFARYSDLLIVKFYRLLALDQDPAFRGSVIDIIHLAEKHNWIEDERVMKRIRELRNVASHDYPLEFSELKRVYQEIFHLTPTLLAAKHQ